MEERIEGKIEDKGRVSKGRKKRKCRKMRKEE